MLGTILGPLLMAGEKPKVPEFRPIDVREEQRESIAGNLAAFDSASQLSGQVNRFNQQQILDMLKMVQPGYQDVSDAQKELLMSELGGQIPKDVSDAVRTSSATRSVYGGFGGSGMGRNLEARDLGLTSLNIMQRGFDHASQWLSQSRNFLANPFDVSSMFVSPSQRIAVSQYNQGQQWNQQWLTNQVEAQPDPLAAAYGQALMNKENQIMGLAGSAIGAFAGGMGGMMGGGGGGFKGIAPTLTAPVGSGGVANNFYGSPSYFGAGG